MVERTWMRLITYVAFYVGDAFLVVGSRHAAHIEVASSRAGSGEVMGFVLLLRRGEPRRNYDRLSDPGRDRVVYIGSTLTMSFHIS
jgi:hypothetical protein